MPGLSQVMQLREYVEGFFNGCLDGGTGAPLFFGPVPMEFIVCGKPRLQLRERHGLLPRAIQ